ncbi:APC family permease [Caulobacter segnis]|uniref:Arginine/agmatine antiporter n=1 Tax=Caulobacter segnis TaxID=88688 RepID=A0A2W5VQ52_9CAUL|nr:amino acid permease [Caulobacter segnis]PZR37445.1 MAG: amino acid permease [Caulobacter segnis]
MCVALVVGNMIGSGVFMLPASLAPYGWNAVIAWLITIGGALCLALVFARLAQAFPRAGGPFVYTEEAFGRPAGFLVAWSYWISVWVSNAAIAIAVVSYASVFVPALARTPGLAALATVAVVWVVTAINCLGARAAGWTQLWTTVLKLLPLAGVAALAGLILLRKGPAAVAPFEPSALSGGGITAAATLTLWALLGVESATVPAEQVDRPQRTIPRATLLGAAFTGLVYLLVSSGVLLLTPVAVLKTSNAPLADFVAYHGGGDLRLVLAAFAAISALGALNGWILLQGEMPAAMARDGVFPAWMAKTSANGAPVRAHLLTSGLVTILVLTNYAKSLADAFTFMALLATASSLFAYLFCALAVLKLGREGRMPLSPGLAIVAGVAAIYSAWTFYGAGWSVTFWGLVLLAAGAPLYVWMRRGAGRAAAGGD